MIVRPTDSGDKQRHHLVADQLVDDRVVADEHLRGGAVEAVEQSRVRAGLEPFAQCGRTAHVGEEDGDVYLRPTRRNSLTASRTQVGVLARLMKSKQPYQFAAESAERIMADFATRRAGQVTEERVHHAKRAMSLDQNFPPELFGLRRRCGLCSHPVLASRSDGLLADGGKPSGAGSLSRTGSTHPKSTSVVF